MTVANKIARPVLLICDMQTRFHVTIHQFDSVAKAVCVVSDLCKQLSIPTIMTTQVSSIFGPCIPTIKSRLPEGTAEFDKKQFSMLTPEVQQLLQQEIRKEIVIVGIETHICVAQTAFELHHQGYPVVILADAVSSSSPQERKLALRRMQSAGITVNSVEGWLFETLGSADHPSFKSVSSILKQTKEDRTRIIQSLL